MFQRARPSLFWHPLVIGEGQHRAGLPPIGFLCSLDAEPVPKEIPHGDCGVELGVKFHFIAEVIGKFIFSAVCPGAALSAVTGTSLMPG